MKTPRTEKLMYFVAIYKDASGGYWAHFADFPATDQGETIEETIAQAGEFLEGIAAHYADSGEALPRPSTLDEAKAKLDPADGTPECFAPVFVYPPSPTVRIQLTARANKIAEIDDYARRKKLTRSELMINASLNYIRTNA